MDVQLSPMSKPRSRGEPTSAGKAPAEVVQELIAPRSPRRPLSGRRRSGFAELDAGQFVTHEEVGKRIERRFR